MASDTEEQLHCRVAVLGSGPAGGIVARRCADAGLKVAVADPGPWGGVCPNTGCEPKKVLSDVADTLARIRGQEGKGLDAPDASIRWPELMDFKRSLIGSTPEAVRASFEKRGVVLLPGPARFTGPDALEAAGKRLRFDKAVVAVGARPRPLDIPGEDLVSPSDDFLELKSLPERIVFIGGGFISFELAKVAAKAGAQALVLHRSASPLKEFDPELVGLLIEQGRMGFAVETDSPVTGVSRKGDALEVAYGPDGDKRVVADMVVHGAGRVPALDGLGLDAAGVEVEEGRMRLDAYLRSPDNPRVFAAGDASGAGPALTPVAVMHARALTRTIIDGKDTKVDHRVVPSVVFTSPPLARVGMLEQEAISRGIDYEIRRGDASGWSEHKRLGVSPAGYAILLEPGTGRVLGAHVLGARAEEVVNLLALAMRTGATAEDLLDQPWSYPSFGYAVRYMLS